MSTMKLYEITDEARQLLQLVEDGEMTEQEIADTLEGVQLEFNEKAEQIGYLLKNLEPFEGGIDAEIKRLQAKKKAIQNRGDSIREYLRINMEACGIKKIECPAFAITLRKPQPKAEVENEQALPDDYVTVKTSFAPDKRAILADLKAGKQIPGAKLQMGTSSVLIK